MLAKQDIVKLLATNDRAIGRALVVLLNNQTADEQATQDTKYQNGEGFTGFDAAMGTSMAQFFLKRGYLSPKQIAVWRKTDKNGNMKIAKYWRQLAEAAERKAAAAKVEMAPVMLTQSIAAKPVDDVGNMQEELMVLEEKISSEEYEYGMYQDSDDEPTLKQMRCNIENLRDRADELRKEIARAYAEMR